ncbi:MAG TPA: hypothetical protein VFZ23_09755 [Pyrinomonadaceae bacterium]
MDRRTYLRSILLALLFPRTFAAQGRPYAKFGPDGETVGLYNLPRMSETCRVRQLVEGVVAAVSLRKRPTETEYRFALEGTVGQRVYKFVLSPDEMSEVDVQDLISRRQRIRVRACRQAGYWAVEEVTRVAVTAGITNQRRKQ